MILRLLVFLASCSTVFAQGLDPDVLREIDVLIETGVSDKRMPGGVLHLEHKKAIYQKSYGKRQLVPLVEGATKETIYDLASLTKVVATTPSIMKLIEEGKVELDAPVQRYLPELGGDANKPKITVRHLLTHTSGLAAGLRGGYEWSGYRNGVALAAGEPSRGMGGFSYRYSDLNFILLGEIVARVSGIPLQEYC
ncbi:beta-lactamase family protein, partial [bacterium]|nr:beta-lactamase family protein [bacterium]